MTATRPLSVSTALLALLCALCLSVPASLRAQDAPAAPAAPQVAETITVKLVTDFESAKLVSDLERMDPVEEMIFSPSGPRSITKGVAAQLWVRNAHVDGKFFFERYYEGKYIGREGSLTIKRADLGEGEHVIEPGGHRFSMAADGALSSDDPSIRVEGDTVMLRLHKVTIMGLDDAMAGPDAARLVGAEMGVYDLTATTRIAIGQELPSIRKLHDPRNAKTAENPLMNVLSHAEPWYPLQIWLPANTEGQGYVLFPSWQTFHITAAGAVQLAAGEGPTVPGVTVEDGVIRIPYREFTGRVNTGTGLVAGVGNVKVGPEMKFSATIETVTFRAGFGKLEDAFQLPVDTDFTKMPNKYFVADNTGSEFEAVRLMALEWKDAVLTRGSDASFGLRLLETPDKTLMQKPVVALRWSPYDPREPGLRVWHDGVVKGWTNDKVDGKLTIQVPDLPAGFVVFRVEITDAANPQRLSPLWAEVPAAIVEPGQYGSASVAADVGRDAFQVGETIALEAVLRSSRPRPAGPRRLVLRGPGDVAITATAQDDGAEWTVLPVEIAGAQSRGLPPGAYTVTVEDLPEGVVALPYAFDLVPRHRVSNYDVIKPSKYTREMNNLVPSHLNDRVGDPVNMDRATETLAAMGYNKIDLMTYITNHHLRNYTWREEMAGRDPRLPAPAAVYQPKPRTQLLNGAVRHGMKFSDVQLSYNDFWVPRYIDGYTSASARWFSRELQDMRVSPAMDGIMIYEEKYQVGISGIVEGMAKDWADRRIKRATEELGVSPAKIESNIQRYMARPKSQRDPAALQQFIEYGDWQQKSWAAFVNPHAALADKIAPWSRIGTYHRTFMGPGHNDFIDHGYVPDLFANLEIVGQVHYADNSTGWVHVPMIARLMRFGTGKMVVPNTPVTHESRTAQDGQYQRLMGFAMLSQGANGVSLWGVPHDFSHGPNPQTTKGMETTRYMNERVLQPYADIVNHATDGYAKVGVVSLVASNILQPFKNIPIAHQTEEIWVSSWRAGYTAVFLREEHFTKPLTSYQVIFVPNIRFPGELTEAQLERLREAIAAGTKVVVEQGSELDLEGVIKLDDWSLTAHYLGKYFPTWSDDELMQIYETTEETTQLFKKMMPEWGVEPTAVGDFNMGPSWWNLGDAHYLIMANYNDPPYGHTVKQQMAEPLELDLRVPARHGAVAYDLLAMKELPLSKAEPAAGHEMRQVTLDMTMIQGGLVAFLPARIGGLSTQAAVSADGYSVRITGSLLDEAGAPMAAGFPAEIRISRGGEHQRTFYRTLSATLATELDLPTAGPGGTVSVQVIERISGQSVTGEVKAPALPQQALTVLSATTPRIPYPADLKRFMTETKTVTVIVPDDAAALHPLATELATGLKARGITATIMNESDAYISSLRGNPALDDPFNDGFHTWRKGQNVIAPGYRVDSQAIVLGGYGGSRLIDGLVDNGFISMRPNGTVASPGRPSVQLATRGLSPDFDTLCLLGDTPAAVRASIQAAFAPVPAAPAAPTYGQPQTWTKATLTTVPVASGVVGNNSYVNGMAFDSQGNVFMTTWGHGDNLYSLAPDGSVRFHRFLPEMGAVGLRTAGDEIFVYTRAGARLYRLKPDGTPVWQAQLNMDPGSVHYRDNYGLSTLNYSYLPKQKRLVHNMGDTMRVFDLDLKLLKEWKGKTYEDKDVSDDILTREPGPFAMSPDGTQIVQIETSEYFTRDGYKDDIVIDSHVVIRDLDGTLLHEFANLDNYKKGSGGELTIMWPTGAAGPVIQSGGRYLEFSPSLEILKERRNMPGNVFRDGLQVLVPNGSSLVLVDETGKESAVFGPFARVLPTVIARSRDDSHFAFLDEYGVLSVWQQADGGKKIGEWTVAERGEELHFTPDGKRVIVGGFRGLVTCWDLTGKQQWQQDLKPLNETLHGKRPLYDPSIPDLTQTVWPRQYDRPGELESLVRLGENRLENSGMETDTAWQGEGLAYAAPGHSGARSLKVGASMLGQEVTAYLGRHVTWVLEFHYRAADPAVPSRLLAGVRIDNKYPDSVARTFEADGSWRFGRVVVKNGLDCERLAVGLLARQGEVLVDDVTLRQIRFPSVNHLLYEPLYEVKPVTLTRMFFSPSYDPFGNVREEAPNRVMVSMVQTGTPNMVESAFLQNGRLNDVGNKWFVQPKKLQTLLSLSMKDARWVNMVVLYFNSYDDANVTPHFDIYATNGETQREELVASVRHNTQTFRVVKFDPIKTPQVTVRLVNSIRRLRTITEVELYGPLSGQEGVAGFLDPEGQNTYMGSFSRVDPRKLTVAPSFGQIVEERHGHHERELGWQPPMAQLLAGDDSVYVSRALGIQDRVTIAEPDKTAERGRANALGFTPYGSLYGGLLLRNGNDGKLYCISPETGARLWSVELGERLFGSGVAIGEDVFAANETGTLFQIDLANGSIMRDVALSGGSLGSLATDGQRLVLATADGTLHARNAKDLAAIWTVPIAPYSDATPAIADGVVYYADMLGRAIAVDLATGKLRWEQPLGTEFARCPVVTPKLLVFGCRDGKLIALDRASGKKAWERQLNTRFQYEPLLVNGDRLLLVDAGLLKTLPLDGKGDLTALTWTGKTRGQREPSEHPADPGDPIVSLTYYKGRVFAIPRHGDSGHTVHQVNYAWHVVGGSFDVYTPPPPPEPADDGKKKEAGK